MIYSKISITVYTDVLLEGWSASIGNASTGVTWLPDEKMMYKNVLELKVVLLTLKSFVNLSHKHIKTMPDDTQKFTALTKWDHHIK